MKVKWKLLRRPENFRDEGFSRYAPGPLLFDVPAHFRLATFFGGVVAIMRIAVENEKNPIAPGTDIALVLRIENDGSGNTIFKTVRAIDHFSILIGDNFIAPSF